MTMGVGMEEELDEEQEVDILPVYEDKTKHTFRIVIPKRGIAEALKLYAGQKVRVKLDRKRRRWIYEIIG